MCETSWFDDKSVGSQGQAFASGISACGSARTRFTKGTLPRRYNTALGLFVGEIHRFARGERRRAKETRGFAQPTAGLDAIRIVGIIRVPLESFFLPSGDEGRAMNMRQILVVGRLIFLTTCRSGISSAISSKSIRIVEAVAGGVAP
jgi:hypothetical protein